MHNRRIIGSALSIAFLISNAQCQSGDWQVVQDLPSGSYISVKTASQTVRCVFKAASSTELFCEDHWIAREKILRIRLEHNVASGVLGAAMGAGIGVGTGVLLTRQSHDEMRIYAPYYLGIGGGIVSAIIMSRISPLHGKVVYRH